MVRNILKIIATLIIGYLMGLFCGGAFGVLAGLLPSLFFQEIAHSNLSVLMSILLPVILGCLLGLAEVLIFNKLSDTNDKPITGSIIGAIFGLLFGFFGYGMLDFSNLETFSPKLGYVLLIYSGAIGSRLGTIIFPIFGVVATIREIVKPNAPIRKELRP
jgi:hypothetical protein